MKSTIQRALFAVAVAALGAGAVGTAAAQSSAPGPASTAHGHHGHHRFGGSPFLATLLRATRQLTGANALTSAQQSQIKTILQGARAAHRPGTSGQGFDLTVIGNPGNSNYATTVNAAAAAASNRIQNDSALAAEIYNHVLNANQQGQLQTILTSMQAQAQARRAQWAAQHAAAAG
jgi:hypothetical protein